MEPPWLENICWGKKLAMNYQIPKRKKNRVLNSDKAFLAKCEASTTLLQQMMELQSDIDFDQEALPVVSIAGFFLLGTFCKCMNECLAIALKYQLFKTRKCPVVI
jgi:hypothetical protein